MHQSSTFQTRTGTVLVLGTDDRVILAVVRSLGRQGLRVHLGWCEPDSVATRSRYVAAYHHIPPYSPANSEWKESLLSLLRSQSFELVIPCNDSTLVPLQSCRHELAQLAHVYLPSDEAFDVVSNKLRTYELAQQLGVPVPAAATVKTRADALAVLRRFEFPVVLKPRATLTLESHGHSNVARLIHSAGELTQCLELPAYSDGAQVQEYFAGTGVGVEMLCCEGEVLFAFQHVRVHETMEYGSSYRRSAALDPDLLSDASKLMQALRYTGVAMAEFIVDFPSQRRVFLEINGRFWGSLPLAVAAGADFPYFLYQMLVEGRREFPQDYKTDVYCRNLLLDWQARRRWLTGGAARRAALLAQNAWQVLTRDRLDSFARDDRRPGWADLRRIGAQFWSKARNKLRPSPSVSPSSDEPGPGCQTRSAVDVRVREPIESSCS
jgi:predicted ATP-grasp superfamily ATP-dependent carboligase